MTEPNEPISGYRPQTDASISLINATKDVEERVLRFLETLPHAAPIDPRWLSIAVTHIQQGFMAAVRSIAKPSRIILSSDQGQNDGDDQGPPSGRSGEGQSAGNGGVSP